MNQTFKQNVLKIVSQIPVGKTLTYSQVATFAGNPRAARVVGMIMSQNYNSEIPCHRVVRKDGTMGGYNRGGIERKMKLLSEEAEIRKP